MKTGIFTISLDFELFWGGVEKRTLPEYNEYFKNTRQVIPEMLAAFSDYDVHATWATVGMLFHRSLQELKEAVPSDKPSYPDQRISSYHYLEPGMIGQDEADSPFHFAPTLIDQIRMVPGQEMGTHTYSHYYCNEPGQMPETFRADIRTAVAVAASKGIQIRSLVFPRNQFNASYLKICYEEGIRAVRSNPSAWFWNITRPSDENIWKRLNRGADAYLPMSRSSFALSSLTQQEGYPLCIPASRFLRPYESRYPFLHAQKIRRICGELSEAAKRNEVYHLWWHPHNFGAHPHKSMEGLKIILDHFKKLQEKYGMTSANMGEITDTVNRRSG